MTDDEVDLDSLEYVEGLSPEDWIVHRDYYGAPMLTIAQAVGRNARRLRLAAGRTLDDVATAARGVGARWTTARVVEFENGERVLTVANLLLVQTVLARVTGRPVALPELISGRYSLEITPRLLIDGERVARSFAGANSGEVYEGAAILLPGAAERDEALERVREVLADATWDEVDNAMVAAPELAEQRAAKSVGVDVMALRVVARRLWGKTLAAERDARARDDSPQARGRATRELVAEVRSYTDQVGRRGDG